jgi:putative heme iron utilization protein
MLRWLSLVFQWTLVLQCFSQAFVVVSPPYKSSRVSAVVAVAAATVPAAAAAAATRVNGENGASTTAVDGKTVQEQHNDNSSESGVYAVPKIRLNVNEKARTVVTVCTSGTLCTISREPGIEGAPFGSFVDYVLDDKGNPILLMNEMSMHTINIRNTKSSSPLVTLFTQLEDENTEGQDISRCSVTGLLQPIDPSDPDMDAIRMRYSISHSYADQVMDSPKFQFYRLTPHKIYFVGGFGVLAKWVDPADYAAAAPDILAKDAATMVRKINREHASDLVTVAESLLQISDLERVRMTSVDRLGIDIRVTSLSGVRRNKKITDEFRIGFRIPVISVEDAKSEILKVFQEAWEVSQNIQWDENEQPGQTVPIVKIAADSLE